jgi:molybdenum cofactor biosynthesis protein B
MNKKNQIKRDFIALNIAILTISDTRTEESDVAGKRLIELLEDYGHITHEKAIVADNIYQIRTEVSKWISNSKVDVILTTGGTGITGRDGTPEAIKVLFDKTIDGFGEVFRNLSHQSIKTSTIQSRAISGVANGTYVFCLPGSVNACVTAWDEIIKFQLDYRTRPCNLVELIPRLKEK